MLWRQLTPIVGHTIISVLKIEGPLVWIEEYVNGMLRWCCVRTSGCKYIYSIIDSDV